MKWTRIIKSEKFVDNEKLIDTIINDKSENDFDIYDLEEEKVSGVYYDYANDTSLYLIFYIDADFGKLTEGYPGSRKYDAPSDVDYYGYSDIYEDLKISKLTLISIGDDDTVNVDIPKDSKIFKDIEYSYIEQFKFGVK